MADVNLLAVLEGLEDDRALFVGDALTTGVYSAAGLAGIAEGDTVAVVGAGRRLLCAQALPSASSVLALDPDPRLALAGRTGSIPIYAREPQRADRGIRAQDGRGADS